MRKAVIAFVLLVISSTAFASDLDDLVSNVVKAYGGAAAWKKVESLRQSGKVSSAMRGTGTQVRTWKKPDRLRVDITYPNEHEVRLVDGTKGWRNGSAVTGMMLDSMRLQADRLALPYLLQEKRASLHDLGMSHEVRIIEVPLEAGTMTVEIDPATMHIVRSRGTLSGGVAFETVYKDFRKVNGLLFPFAEENFAQGMHTADTVMEKIEVNPKVIDSDFRPTTVAMAVKR